MRSNFVHATVSNVSSGLKFHQQRRRLNQVERDSHRSKLYNDNVRTATNDDATSLIFIYFTSTQGGESHKRLSAANRTVTRALLLYNIDLVLINISIISLVLLNVFNSTSIPIRTVTTKVVLSFCCLSLCPLFSCNQNRWGRKRAIKVNSAFKTGRAI